MSAILIFLIIVLLFIYFAPVMLRWLLQSLLKNQAKRMEEMMRNGNRAGQQQARQSQAEPQGRKGTSATSAEAEYVDFEEIKEGREPVAASEETLRSRDPNSSKTTSSGHVYVEDAEYEEV